MRVQDTMNKKRAEQTQLKEKLSALDKELVYLNGMEQGLRSAVIGIAAAAKSATLASKQNFG